MAENQKDTKKRKQAKKMTKILSRAWEHPNSAPFQQSSKPSAQEHAFDLRFIGQSIDDGSYSALGMRSGWEHFAKDIGGVYNRHIERKSKHCKAAEEQRKPVLEMLGKVEKSLIPLAQKHVPGILQSKSDESSSQHSRKRKGHELNGPNRKRTSSAELTVSERQARAVSELCRYIESVGGNEQQVSSFEAKVSKRNDGRYETVFFLEGRRFKSMVDVGRFLGLVEKKGSQQQKTRKSSSNKKLTSFKEAESERRKLRKELDKLMKAHQKATKALDDFVSDRNETLYPVDDDILMEESNGKQEENNKMSPIACPAARIPDLDGFPGVPAHCLPDLLMVWDFLCTFNRTLSLNPISLDDFVAALTYAPPMEADGLNPPCHQPPVYLAECHLSLLKLLLQDVSSDDWWWSILDTDEHTTPEGEEADATIDPKVPVIKIDFATLLSIDEDPLITASWLQALEPIRNFKETDGRAIKHALKAAKSVVANKMAKAYLKKSMTNWSPTSAGFTKRAIVWLVDRVREARPDLFGRNISDDMVFERRAKVVEEVAHSMEKISDSAGIIEVEDIPSDAESDDDEDSDDSDDEPEMNEPDLTSSEEKDEKDAPVKSSIPIKPLPSIVDLLLPPAKPFVGPDLVNPFSWPQLVGASVCRIIHRYKRLRNEVDDSLRDFRGLQPMSIGERRDREHISTARVLSECTADYKSTQPSEKAADHLTNGGHYLMLNPVERLCMLRLLVEAAYDSTRVHGIVDGNFKSRLSAEKALDAEKRKAKKEAREEAAATERAAREQLANQAKQTFFEEKREELRKLNSCGQEYSNELVDGLTEEDIIDFDEDTRAEYDALPTPQSFNKTEVNNMVKQMQEEAAFDAEAVTVIGIGEIAERDEQAIRDMEEDILSFESTGLSELGREGTRKLERLRRDLESRKEMETSIAVVRESAMETLRDAIEDGTIKSLKAAVRTAKNAHLMGEDRSTGGVWVVDLLRDAALELKTAEGRKRVIEAQKELVTKRNKCFIRTDPVGRDRFRNSFWHFDADESGRVWTEVDYIIGNKTQRSNGFVDLVHHPSQIGVGADEMDKDLIGPEADDYFHPFVRKEHHSSGALQKMGKRYWGCHATDKSLKGLMKNLDTRGTRERELKTNLNETLEESGLVSGALDAETSGAKESTTEEPGANEGEREVEEHQKEQNEDAMLIEGDENVFREAVSMAGASTMSSNVVSPSLVAGLSTAIGSKVRVRQIDDPNKDETFSTYHNGIVTGWRMTSEVSQTQGLDEDNMAMLTETSISYPVWKVTKDRGGEDLVLAGPELIESICRYKRWKNNDESYFEGDAFFLTYRNSQGRHCGRAAEAGVSATPFSFGRLMVRREQELYSSLKVICFDNNNWGGKNGARNAWISSMKDFCNDFITARNGLLSLESAFFEMTGGFPGSVECPSRTAESMLDDDLYRVDIELESIEKGIKTLWNCWASRKIYRHIVESCLTTGILALALDLLCRNCRIYIGANKVQGRGRAAGRAAAAAISSTSYEDYAPPPMRTTRRMNAWQQANKNKSNNDDDDDDEDDEDDDDEEWY